VIPKAGYTASREVFADTNPDGTLIGFRMWVLAFKVSAALGL
jgi:hypothetical protein